ASPATKERTPETSTRAGSCETASTSADIEPRLMSNAAASAIRDGPIRPAIVFEFAMDCLPARCRCGTGTDKNTHREKPAISRRERAENERAPPLHDNPKARRRGGRHTRGAAACCDARFRPHPQGREAGRFGWQRSARHSGSDFPTRFPTELLTTGWEMVPQNSKQLGE